MQSSMVTLMRASVTANTGVTLQAGDPVQILTDGSDSPITANGLTGYLATPGDRLLVQKVGGQVEIVQFLSRGTVPYLGAGDISDLEADIATNSDTIAANSATVANLTDTLDAYQADTDSALTTLQGSYDVLHGIGTAGVQEDYFWVGDDPALSTVKPVQISPFVQNGLSAGDSIAFASYFSLYSANDIGDTTTLAPENSFYGQFTTNSRTARPWN